MLNSRKCRLYCDVESSCLQRCFADKSLSQDGDPPPPPTPAGPGVPCSCSLLAILRLLLLCYSSVWIEKRDCLLQLLYIELPLHTFLMHRRGKSSSQPHHTFCLCFQPSSAQLKLASAWPAQILDLCPDAGLQQYESKRGYADARSVSRVSPYLRWGQLSPRHMHRRVAQVCQPF